MAPSVAISKIPGASLELIGEKVNLLVDAIEELRKLGLKELDTELPELVLIGDQSAGKSSLMSAIAEINLPKDMGMCTRAPSNIKTSPSPTWSCTVSLRLDYTFTTGKRRVPTKSMPFPPWTDNTAFSPDSIKLFKTISEKSELEDVLKWAQIALLNPNQDYRQFIPGSGTVAQNGLKVEYTHEADYSPNIVQIEIFGPRLPALSFYDLPGIFVNPANDEQHYLIDTFENLTAKYIQHKNALVICALTMATDPASSKTSSLIRKYHAQDRTIGVLTKPDLLQKGSNLDFDKILKGDAYKLRRGYFITKQPGATFKPRSTDYHIQARAEEAEYFSSDPRWTGDWLEFKDRCGTPALQTYLSQEFARLIANSMPNIDEKIRAQAAQVDEELLRLPELPHNNVQHVVRQCLHNLSNGIQSLFEKGNSTHNFLSNWTIMSEDFGRAIQEIKPGFVISDRSDAVVPDVVVLDDSDNESIMSTVSRKRPISQAFTTPQKRPKFNDSTASLSRPKQEPSTPGSNSGNTVTSRARKTVFDAFLDRGKRFQSVHDVRETIYRHRYPGHPDTVTSAAREEICLLSVDPWIDVLDRLGKITFKKLWDAVVDIMHRTLGNYQQTELFRRSFAYLLEFLQAQQKVQIDALNAFYHLERNTLFTVNSNAFTVYKAEELKILQAARRKWRVRCFIQKNAKMGKVLTSKEEAGITDEQLGVDPFVSEVLQICRI
jgi:hypothetical protein